MEVIYGCLGWGEMPGVVQPKVLGMATGGQLYTSSHCITRILRVARTTTGPRSRAKLTSDEVLLMRPVGQTLTGPVLYRPIVAYSGLLTSPGFAIPGPPGPTRHWEQFIAFEMARHATRVL